MTTLITNSLEMSPTRAIFRRDNQLGSIINLDQKLTWINNQFIWIDHWSFWNTLFAVQWHWLWRIPSIFVNKVKVLLYWALSFNIFPVLPVILSLSMKMLCPSIFMRIIPKHFSRGKAHLIKLNCKYAPLEQLDMQITSWYLHNLNFSLRHLISPARG